MKKVMVVFGTRPEAIKMAPIIKEMEKRDNIECIVCVSGQHREMLDQVLEVFKIKPKYDLNIMKHEQTITDITVGVLTNIEDIIKKENPDIILVHGDTTTAFSSALAAFYNKVLVGHVEAGLRTYNKYSPYPEEINRQMISVLSDYHFAPTKESADNLKKEGKNEQSIFITGNTVIDSMKYTVDNNYTNEIFDWVGKDKMILLTAHRRENLGKPMYDIFTAIKKVVDDFEDVKVVYPIHLNPKIRKIADEVIGNSDKIKIIEPLDVKDFHNFINRSYIILTDSGGIQEEAPSLGKPVLVLRDTTERPEGLKAGTLKLVGTDIEKIYNETSKLLTDLDEYKKMSEAINPYGDGKASERIVDIIERI